MIIEAESIPYEPALLRGERLLVLAPHPDDEVIGCGGLVAQHLAEGRRVRIVVATDGAAAGNRGQREEESRRGVALLGDAAELVFLGHPDRGLAESAHSQLREQLQAFRPDLVLVPSPIEIHPDHVALSRIFCGLIQQDEQLFAELAVTRVAFYEVSAPLPRPNAIVDITNVAETKYAAIGEHASQLVKRDYVAYARGLNAYRAMTLPSPARVAEAYFVVTLAELHTIPFSRVRERVGAMQTAGDPRPSLPVSVIIRTKDRPALLQEAIASVRANGHRCELVIVNDGGTDPLLEPAPDLKVIQHAQSLGRAEAANAGARAAAHDHIVFLDDDDLLYPEHLATLTAAAMNAPQHIGWYGDAVSAFLAPGPDGNPLEQSRLRLYAQDYDPELLRIDNYIPLPTILLPRKLFLDLGGFDPSFDLFEDWDFLIRMSQRGSFSRIPQLVCEVRHFEGSSSIVLAAPEGSSRFRHAKLQIWSKHAALLTPDVIASVFERQKQRARGFYTEAVELNGRAIAAEVEIDRSAREAVNAQNMINGYALRVRELEGALALAQSAAQASLTLVQELVSKIESRTVELDQAHREIGARQQALEQVQQQIVQEGETGGRLRAEIERLNGLLAMIYRSRTWKVHTTLEKMRGRG